mmetsp:Transcript_55413/g.119171  ORF Transcript_55413/g.119171 Transcript_55413/m.119171 type:complete len:301 (+) Transcript_55413:2568-3470(+)
MRLDEVVRPLQSTLVRQAHGEDHLVLAVLWGRVGAHRGLFRRGSLDHLAREWQGDHWRRAEASLHGHAPEGDGRIERLALEALRQRLWLAGSLPVDEEADRVGVWAGGIQVENYGNGHMALKPWNHPRALRPAEKCPFVIEADAILRIPNDGAGARRGEAHPQQILRLDHPLVLAEQVLHDLRLKHVPARLHADTGPCASQKVLDAAISERHEQIAHRGWQDVHCHVGHQEGHRILDRRLLIRRRILFELLRRLWRGHRHGLLHCLHLLRALLRLRLLGRRLRHRALLWGSADKMRRGRS